MFTWPVLAAIGTAVGGITLVTQQMLTIRKLALEIAQLREKLAESRSRIQTPTPDEVERFGTPIDKLKNLTDSRHIMLFVLCVAGLFAAGTVIAVEEDRRGRAMVAALEAENGKIGAKMKELEQQVRAWRGLVSGRIVGSVASLSGTPVEDMRVTVVSQQRLGVLATGLTGRDGEFDLSFAQPEGDLVYLEFGGMGLVRIGPLNGSKGQVLNVVVPGR
jgi:hypothetical protein